MTKKLAELLMQHKKDCDEMDEYLFTQDIENYKKAYDIWVASGDKCKEEINSYTRFNYLPAFYGYDNFDIYDRAQKYLNKLKRGKQHE